MQTFSLTQLGNVIKLISGVLVIVGFTPITPEQENALLIVIGLVGEVAGFLMSWIGRARLGGVTLLGFRK